MRIFNVEQGTGRFFANSRHLLVHKMNDLLAKRGGPVVAGGLAVWAFANRLSRSWPAVALVAPLDHDGAHEGNGLRDEAFKKNMEAAVPGLNRFLPCAAGGLACAWRLAKVDVHRAGARHLWQTVQWSATSPNSSQWAIETPVGSAPRRGRPRSAKRWPGFCCAVNRAGWPRRVGGADGLHFPQRRQLQRSLQSSLSHSAA